jgi:acyl-CoA carboxylase epsilon subunit
MSTTDDSKFEFSVVKGAPTEDELAAVVTVLTECFTRPQHGEPTPAQSGWSAYWRSVRSPIQPGPSAWRMSGRPQ